ncbi:MAG TPA: cysteine dioxygenase family protein [Candidatus Cryosericum sp.]|nr:cysteine dioxygenase family protein [Candidatus Cryosericum sp.]
MSRERLRFYNPAMSHFSLDDFVAEMAHVPSQELTLPVLHQLSGSLDIRDDLIRDHIYFSAGSYTRNLVCRTPRFDMLVLCWRPGHVTTIHDHCGSLNATRVLHGKLTSRLFREAGRPTPDRCLVELSEEERLGPGGFSLVDRDEIHQLANTSGEDLVTLHVYAKPLRDILVYDPATGGMERVTLRYSLEQDFQ